MVVGEIEKFQKYFHGRTTTDNRHTQNQWPSWFHVTGWTENVLCQISNPLVEIVSCELEYLNTILPNSETAVLSCHIKLLLRTHSLSVA